MAEKKVSKKTTAKKTAVKKVVRIPLEEAPVKKKIVIGKTTLSDAQLAHFKEKLEILRERVSGEYSTLSRDNIAANQRDPSLSDQGSDTFDREMELNMMGSEQSVIFEIDGALRRIEKGEFGICELTGDPINIERLEALPYVRYTVKAQSELEKGHSRFRPFGGTMRG